MTDADEEGAADAVYGLNDNGPHVEDAVPVERVGKILAGFGSHVTGKPRIDTVWIVRDSWKRDAWKITDGFRYMNIHGKWIQVGPTSHEPKARPLADCIVLCQMFGCWDDDPTPPEEVR